MAHLLGLLDHVDRQSIEGLHVGLAILSHWLTPPERTALWIGLGPAMNEHEIAQRLAALLCERGVPADGAHTRAMQGIRKIGAQQIAVAMQGPKAWQALKELASRPQFNFQWIASSELQAQIRARAEAKFHIKPSMKKHAPPKRKQREGMIAPTVDPTLLSILPKTFEAAGKEIAQIGFSDFKQGAIGIVVVALQDIASFLKDGTVLSPGPLAALTTAQVPDGTPPELAIVHLRYPVQYQGTNEPILLQGSLIQFGRVPVQRTAGNSAQLEAVATQTLRVTLFRDLWQGDWNQVIRQPFREILMHHPTLQLCRQSGCGDSCQKFHPPVDEPIDNLIMDVWARAWHSLDGRFCSPDKAEFWSALLRVPSFAQLSIQQLSGSCGAFFEPRSPNGRETDMRFQVVWLTEAGLAEVIYKVKTTPEAIAAVRVSHKYGVRFAKENLEAGFTALRPHEKFIPIDVQKVWQVMPLPFGTQKAKLQACITAMPWTAKVLQQSGSSPMGSTWEVGSSTNPPTNVFMVDGQDVMITLLREAGRQATPTDFVASSGTRVHLRGQQPKKATKLDPWLLADPWSAATRVDLAQTKVAQVESRLKQNIDETAAALRAEFQPTEAADQTMADDSEKQATEARFLRIESSLQEQQMHGVKMENWLNQIAGSSNQMGAQIAQLHQGLAVQHDQVQLLQTEVAQTNERMSSIGSEVRTEMEKGMAHLAALLEKRSRTD